MTKGILILRTLIEKNRLKEICNSLKIGYEHCLSIANEQNSPSLNTMKKLRFLIPLEFWIDEANNEFIKKIESL